MTNSASSERLHKQFCQTHISTIDRPDRRQPTRERRRLKPVTLANGTHNHDAQNFLKRPDRSRPFDALLAAAVPHAEHMDQQTLTDKTTMPTT